VANSNKSSHPSAAVSQQHRPRALAETKQAPWRPSLSHSAASVGATVDIGPARAASKERALAVSKHGPTRWESLPGSPRATPVPAGQTSCLEGAPASTSQLKGPIDRLWPPSHGKTQRFGHGAVAPASRVRCYSSFRTALPEDTRRRARSPRHSTNWQREIAASAQPSNDAQPARRSTHGAGTWLARTLAEIFNGRPAGAPSAESPARPSPVHAANGGLKCRPSDWCDGGEEKEKKRGANCF
jgi:hypothetical protein